MQNNEESDDESVIKYKTKICEKMFSTDDITEDGSIFYHDDDLFDENKTTNE